MRRESLTVKGRVQGVGYRNFVLQLARKFSLTGWVRNCSNGDVECEAQGSEQDLERFFQQLEVGHPWARVERIAREPMPEKLNEKEFEINY